jgi:hypothetical protein
VMWERGFINPTNIDRYTMNGRQDACGVFMPDTSLKFLMGNYEDFEEDDSLCCCELAGEGIEYTSRCSKNYFQSLRLHDKRGKEKFWSAVEKFPDREIFMTERIRNFSRRACHFICAYYKITKEKEEKENDVTTHLATHLDATPIHVEKMVKLFKTHQCTLDFDTTFFKEIIIKEEGENE